MDKTGLIDGLNNIIDTPFNCLSVSHARRFGKSQAAGMIDAYYSCGCDSKELFSEFQISKKTSFTEHLNKYNVIHLDISSVTDYVNGKVVSEIIKRLVKDFRGCFGDNIDYEQSISGMLSDIYNITQKAFIIIIDVQNTKFLLYPNSVCIIISLEKIYAVGGHPAFYAASDMGLD